MELKIFFSPTEIKQFFLDNGFQVIQQEFGRWDKRTHLTSKYNSWMEDVVVHENNTVKASDLFQSIAEQRLKIMFTPRNGEGKKLIETHFKQLLKTD
jgi:hypothetical protein